MLTAIFRILGGMLLICSPLSCCYILSECAISEWIFGGVVFTSACLTYGGFILFAIAPDLAEMIMEKKEHGSEGDSVDAGEGRPSR